MPENPHSAPAQLRWWIGIDDCLYAQELQSGCQFKLTEIGAGNGGTAPPAGVPEAPTDGQLYGRENAAWLPVPTGGGNAVQKTGDTMSGTLKVSSADGSAGIEWDETNHPFSIAYNTSYSGWPAIDINTMGTHSKIAADTSNLTLESGGNVVRLGPGNWLRLQDPGGFFDITKGGSQDLVVTSGNWSGSVNLTNQGLGITWNNGTVSTTLKMDPAAGDIIATAVTGPNAGKSVNLTTGKWA